MKKTQIAFGICSDVLAMDTCAFWRKILTKHVFETVFKQENSEVINRSMIVREGRLTPRFEYLTGFAGRR